MARLVLRIAKVASFCAMVLFNALVESCEDWLFCVAVVVPEAAGFCDVRAAPAPPDMAAIAAEAALKLKETSAIHAEAFSSAEILHGPAGVIGPGFPVLGFAPVDEARDGFFETVERLAGFGAAPFLVDVERHAKWPTLVAADAGHPMLTPIVGLHAFYRLAEATARARGRNPDEPPHLQKVTRTI